MPSSTTNAAQLMWLRQALQDPVQRPQILNEIREQGLNTTMDPIPGMSNPTLGTTPGFSNLSQSASTLSALGNAMSKATPGTAGATGAWGPRAAWAWAPCCGGARSSNSRTRRASRLTRAPITSRRPRSSRISKASPPASRPPAHFVTQLLHSFPK